MGRKALQLQQSPKINRRLFDPTSVDGSSISSSCHSSPLSPSTPKKIHTSSPSSGLETLPPEANTPQKGVEFVGAGLDRLVLERSIGRLLAEHGINLLKEVAANSPGSIDTLLKNKELIGASRRQPVDLSTLSDLNIDALLALQEEKEKGPQVHISMPDLSQQGDLSESSSPTLGDVPRKSSLSTNQKDRHNRSVRFDPSQVGNPDASRQEGRPRDSTDSSSSSGSAPTALEVNPTARVSRHRESGRRHRRRDSKAFPRSRSYSGSGAHGEEQAPKKAPSVPGLERAQWDNESVCSTCSSSSSDDFDYELPPRRAYGGVRISYVPNDALAYARRQAGTIGSEFQPPNSPSIRKRLAEKDKNCIIS